MTIEFRTEKKRAQLHDPRAGFELTEVESEIRHDALTGTSARICHFSLKKLPPVDLAPMVEQSRAVCPFCPERIEAVTPRYPENVLAGGRMRHGDALLVPNLFPYDDISAVAVLTKEHYLAMDSFPEKAVRDGVTLSRNFFVSTGSQVAGGEGYGMLSWNYMPPSGGSQVHPHMQVVLTTNPGNAVRRELAAESAYRERTGRRYADDLLEAEQKNGDRWLGSVGNVAWLVPFVPSGLLGDAQAFFPGRASVTDLTDADIADFARGLVRILRGFSERGLWSFNLAFYPARFGSDGLQTHALSVRVLTRMFVNPALHVSDASSMMMMLDERAAMVYPEETAVLLKKALAA